MWQLAAVAAWQLVSMSIISILVQQATFDVHLPQNNMLSINDSDGVICVTSAPAPPAHQFSPPHSTCSCLAEHGRLCSVARDLQEKTTDYIVGFDELGGKDDFSTDVRSCLLLIL